MAISGLQNTDTYNNPTGRRPQNYRETLLMLYPNGAGMDQAPLTALTAVMKSEPTTDPIFHWFQKSLQTRRVQLGANLAASTAGTTQTVTLDASTSALGLKAKDILHVEETGEKLFVNTTPTSATSMSVTRGFGLVAGTAVAVVTYNGAGVNPMMKIIGSAFEEGSTRPDPISFDPNELSNQTQIFRSAYALTGSAAATKTRTGIEVRENKRECMEYFGIDMEMAFFFGERSTSSLNGQPLRTTAGVLSRISASNTFVAPAGGLDPTTWEGYMTQMFRYGSSEKIAFCGATALTAMTQMVRKNSQANWEIGGSVKEYGMEVRRFYTPMGRLVLKPHPLFAQMTGGTNGGTAYTSMDNSIVVLDMNNIKYRYLEGRDVKYEPKLEQNGEDAIYAGWLAECGLEVNHASTHGWIKGLKAGAKDA